MIEGQDTLDNLYKGYGDMPPFGEGPDQSQIFQQGNAYVRSLYPKIDFLNTCSLIDSEPEAVEQEMHEEHSEFEPEDDDNGKPQEQGDVVNHDEVKKAVPDIAESADKEEEGSGDQAAAEEASEVSEQCLQPST